MMTLTTWRSATTYPSPRDKLSYLPATEAIRLPSVSDGAKKTLELWRVEHHHLIAY
jgi:hypothetical protein